MHFSPGTRLSVFAIALFSGAVLSACLNAGPTANEIVAKSREYSESVESYAVSTTLYLYPARNEATTTDMARIDRPDRVQYLDESGAPRAIAVGDYRYQIAASGSNKWLRLPVETPGSLDVLDLIFPTDFLEAEVVESDGDYYVIEGFGVTRARPDFEILPADRMKLIILKTNFALIELTDWDFPPTRVDENGEIEILADPESYQDMAHMRVVFEFSRYDEEFSIEAPTESDIVVELLKTIPEDGERLSSLTGVVGFFLSEAAPVMDLTVQPAIQLNPIEPDNRQGAIFTGYKTFRASPSFERDTTYTATLKWGESESDLNTHTWTFTTR